MGISGSGSQKILPAAMPMSAGRPYNVTSTTFRTLRIVCSRYRILLVLAEYTHVLP